MYANQRTIPHKLRVLEVLKYGRIPATHSKMSIIDQDFHKRKAGYNGEVAVDYYLKFLPQKEYTIFHGIRLPHKDTYLQMDTLLLSKKFALILEIKNIFGTLFFDEKSGQFIRIQSDGTEEGFENPMFQAERQKQLLKNFFKLHSLTDVPVDFFVVISRSSTILKPFGSPIFQKVCHGHLLNFKIEHIEKLHQKEILDQKTFKRSPASY